MRWTERIVVDRPIEQVRRAVADEHELMQWSVDFRFEDLDGSRTRVHLDFRATAPLPSGARHVAEVLLGRRVRRLHVEDLQLLKAHVEKGPSAS
ncbi:MAG TPA: SRPBCC family protein [Pseudonocardia sp.]|nr:SRPBCC family protein [Pseudonocardia sp.]